MSDLIKREDAIEELADYMYEIALLKADGRLDTMEHYLNRAKAMLKRIPSADRPSESIGKLIERMEEYRDKQLLMSDYWYGINWAINTIRVSDVADRPQGEWIEQEDDYHHYWECSECGMGVGLDDIRNFCPHCGAHMKGADNDTD